MPISSSQLADDVVSVLKRTVTLNDAQIKALPTTPVVIIPAPGAGKRISVIKTELHIHSAGDYANIDSSSQIAFQTLDGQWNFATAITNEAVTPLTFVSQLLAGADLDAFMEVLPVILMTENYGPEPQVGPLAVVENAAVYLVGINAGGNFTEGNAVNTLKVTMLYAIIDV